MAIPTTGSPAQIFFGITVDRRDESRSFPNVAINDNGKRMMRPDTRLRRETSDPRDFAMRFSRYDDRPPRRTGPF